MPSLPPREPPALSQSTAHPTWWELHRDPPPSVIRSFTLTAGVQLSQGLDRAGGGTQGRSPSRWGAARGLRAARSRRPVSGRVTHSAARGLGFWPPLPCEHLSLRRSGPRSAGGAPCSGRRAHTCVPGVPSATRLGVRVTSRCGGAEPWPVLPPTLWGSGCCHP